MADAGEEGLVWAVSDGKTGHAVQAKAMAEALFPSGVPIVEKVARVGSGQALRSLLPAWGAPGIGQLCQECEPPWPSLVVSCSRKAAVVALAVRRLSSARVVQVIRPFRDPRHFDAVVVPRHDRMAGPNIVSMHGSVVDGGRISGLARPEARGRFAGMPGRNLALLVGGSTGAFALGADIFADLVARVGEAARRSGMRVLAVTSRRSPRGAEGMLRDRLSEDDFVWDGSGENPYWEVVAAADVIAVTGDSISMVSEACSSGRPTYVIGLPERSRSRSRKFRSFHRDLEELGAARMFKGELTPWPARPLNELPRVVGQVRRLLGPHEARQETATTVFRP